MTRRSAATELPKIAAPDLPPIAATAVIASSELRPGSDLENITFQDVVLGQEPRASLKLRHVRFIRVKTSGCKLGNLRLVDSSHDSCDWANASWDHSRVHRCLLDDCKMIGFTASDSRFENARFRRCNLDLSVFHRTHFISCAFEDCVLRESSFEEAVLENVTFRNCDLRNVRMVRARFNDVDLRGSLVDGLQADPQSMRGTLINASQALPLIHLLGVRVRELDSE